MKMPETLTQDQIAFYQESGYLVLENQIPDSWMHRIRTEISRFEDEAALLNESNDRLDLEDSHTKHAPRLRRIKLPHTISNDLKELMLSDYILGPARDLIGPNLRLHTSKLNAVPFQLGLSAFKCINRHISQQVQVPCCFSPRMFTLPDGVGTFGR